MATRGCYQCGDGDIEEIRQKRNEEIREYGRQVHEIADQAFRQENLTGGLLSQGDDWDRVVSDTSEAGTSDVMDALAATEPQNEEENQKKIDATPKPAAQADGEIVENVDASPDEDAPRAPAEDAPKKPTSKAKTEK